MIHNNEFNSMKDVINDIDSSMNNIKVGEIVNGKVISVTDKEIIVNIGYMTDGVIKASEVSEKLNSNIKDAFKIGDELSAYVLKMSDEDGNVLLSKIEADKILQWNKLKNDFKNEVHIEVIVKEAVKGGVIAYLNNIKAFIPASQLSVKYVDDLNEFVGKSLQVKIIELDENKSRVILSRKEVEKIEIERKRQDALNRIEPGQKVKGKVDKLAKFGAFVDLGGIDGLIHISELSWERVKNPEDVVSVGDEIEVYVLDVDKENSKVSLSLKDVQDNPWHQIDKKYNIGDIVNGKVVKLIDIGAFVEIEPGLEGMVHISEMSDEHIAKPTDVVKTGDMVKVKILNIDEIRKRLSLSMKDALGNSDEDYNKYIDKEEGFSLGEIFKNIDIK